MTMRIGLVLLVVACSWSAMAAEFTLTVDVAPANAGAVSRDPDAPAYAVGTKVTLTAIPRAGYEFDYWAGALSGNRAQQIVAMNSDKQITAVFKPIQCSLSAVSVLTPRDGVTVTVGPDSDAMPLVLAATTDCVGDTGSVKFVVDGTWQAIALECSATGVFSVAYPMAGDLGYGAHTLEVTAAGALHPETTFTSMSTFTLAKAAVQVDTNLNGLPDSPFDALPLDGASWLSWVSVRDTLNVRVTGAIRWDGLSGEAIVTLKNPALPGQTVTITAPNGLLEEGETGVLLVQMATDLDTLFGAVERSMLGQEPSVLVGGGQYIEASVLVSPDGGYNFYEMDSARYDDYPLHMTIKGVNVTPASSALVYAHDSGVVRNPIFGVELVGWQGPWNTDAVRHLVFGEGTIDADLVSLSVFAPYQTPESGPELTLLPDRFGTEDFGWVPAGSTSDGRLTVRNTGGGVLSGVASVANPGFVFVTLKIQGGTVVETESAAVPYNLGPGRSQKLTLRFKPTEAKEYRATVLFTGAGDGVIYAHGLGYPSLSPFDCHGGGTVPSRGVAGDLLLLGAALAGLAALGRSRSSRRVS